MNKIATYEEFIGESSSDNVFKLSVPHQDPAATKKKIEDVLKEYFDDAVPKDIEVSTKHVLGSDDNLQDRTWRCEIDITFGREIDPADANELKTLIKKTVEQ